MSVRWMTFWYWWAVAAIAINGIYTPIDAIRELWGAAAMDVFWVVLNLFCLDFWAKRIKRKLAEG